MDSFLDRLFGHLTSLTRDPNHPKLGLQYEEVDDEDLARAKELFRSEFNEVFDSLQNQKLDDIINKLSPATRKLLESVDAALEVRCTLQFCGLSSAHLKFLLIIGGVSDHKTAKNRY